MSLAPMTLARPAHCECAVLLDDVRGHARPLRIVARRALEELVAEISPTPLLLVATGRDLPAERDFNRIYAEAAQEPVELWELPEVNHTAAIRERPAQYERRVVGFFRHALAREPR